MSLTIIIKESSKDRQRRIYDRVDRSEYLKDKAQGIAKSCDEANDIAYHQHGEQSAPIVVEGGPEVKTAFQDDMTKIGQDPERVARQWGLS